MSQQPLFAARAISERALAFDRAADNWGLNCGPGAICGALALHPEAVRPHLGKFEHRKYPYMSPSDMWAALHSLGIEFRALKVEGWLKRHCWPKSNGICRVQWGGPWCKPGKPPAAAYRHTHWIAARRSAADRSVWIFDVNNLIGPGSELGAGCPDGWLPEPIWAAEVVPELLPRNGDGQWWITHTAEITRF